jgi:hypothetical protein
MNQLLIAVLAVACFVVAVDLIVTRVRQRARSKSVTSELPLTEQDPIDETKEGIAIEQE